MRPWPIIIVVLAACGVGGYILYAYWLAPPREHGPAPGSVQALLAALESPDARTRREAVAALGDLGPNGAEAVPALTRALHHADAETRYEAALALVKIQAEVARPALPTLIEGLKSRRSQTRTGCAWSLLTFVPPPREALPALLQALHDPNVEMRKAAGYVLAEYRQPEDVEKTVPALAALLKTPDEARSDFIWALSQIGPAAEKAEPALLLTLKDEDKALQRAAAFALVKIVGAKATSALPVLVEALKDKEADAELRRDTAHVLGMLGPAGKPAVPALRELLKDESDEVRKATQEALGKIEKR